MQRHLLFTIFVSQQKYSGTPLQWEFPLYRGDLIPGMICTKRVHLGLSEVAFIEGCPHIRGVYKRFHCKAVISIGSLGTSVNNMLAVLKKIF